MVLVADTGQECIDPDTPDTTKFTRPPIEIRAILVRCLSRSNVYKNVGSDKDHIANSRNREVLQFYGFDEDEPMLHSEVTKCKKKLQISILLNYDGEVWNEADYLIINTAYDPIAKERVRLLHPVVLKLKQDPVGQAYQMVIDHIVNAKAYEEIISKANCPHFEGCDVSDNPTCGRAYYNGKPIPYSEGFCCSCDEAVNTKRQPVRFRSIAPKAEISSLSMAGLMPQSRNPHKRRKRPKKSIPEGENSYKSELKVSSVKNNVISQVGLNDSASVKMARNISITNGTNVNATSPINVAVDNKNEVTKTNKEIYFNYPDKGDKHCKLNSSVAYANSTNDTITIEMEHGIINDPSVPIISFVSDRDSLIRLQDEVERKLNETRTVLKEPSRVRNKRKGDENPDFLLIAAVDNKNEVNKTNKEIYLNFPDKGDKHRKLNSSVAHANGTNDTITIEMEHGIINDPSVPIILFANDRDSLIRLQYALERRLNETRTVLKEPSRVRNKRKGDENPDFLLIAAVDNKNEVNKTNKEIYLNSPDKGDKHRKLNSSVAQANSTNDTITIEMEHGIINDPSVPIILFANDRDSLIRLQDALERRLNETRTVLKEPSRVRNKRKGDENPDFLLIAAVDNKNEVNKTNKEIYLNSQDKGDKHRKLNSSVAQANSTNDTITIEMEHGIINDPSVPIILFANDRDSLIRLQDALERKLNETRTVLNEPSRVRNKRKGDENPEEKSHHLMYENVSKTEVIENAIDREFPIQPEKYYIFPPFYCPKGFSLDEARGSLKLNPWNGYLEHRVHKTRLPFRYFHQIRRNVNGDRLRNRRNKRFKFFKHIKNYFQAVPLKNNATLKTELDPTQQENLRKYYTLFPVPDGSKGYDINKRPLDANEKHLDLINEGSNMNSLKLTKEKPISTLNGIRSNDQIINIGHLFGENSTRGFDKHLQSHEVIPTLTTRGNKCIPCSQLIFSSTSGNNTELHSSSPMNSHLNPGKYH
ncbi:unnamed protein product [Nezara viridula]|uniref:Generative cell specific-1/HAP2 domain-containing protein n=1 Tax=Nezara viridula TaxID=85310 RepID=A0A9P0H3B1_NEZVI|nr:unnamed protein product [Nezara viridula]